MDCERDQLESKRKQWPLLWTVATAVAVCLASVVGTAGYLAAKLSDNVLLSQEIPFYIQAGTTLVTLTVSMCETVVIITLVRHIKWKIMDSITRSNQMVPFRPIARQDRDFTVGGILGIYIATLGINIGILLFLWSITVAQMYPSHSQFKGFLWPFILTDIIVALISPMVIICSIIPLVKIVRYVTHAKLETRKLLPWLLPFLSYKRGKKVACWVLEDSFYYKIHGGYCGNLSTALLYTTAALNFLFSWVYFVDDIFVNQMGFNDCNGPTSAQKQYLYCFNIHPTSVFINCTSNVTYSGSLFCFEFKEAGRNINILQSIVISVVLYYISVLLASLILKTMKLLQKYALSYLWPTLIVALSFFVFIFGLVHFASAVYFNYHLNVLTLFQILIASVNIAVLGILVAGGNLVQDKQQCYSENTSNTTSPYHGISGAGLTGHHDIPNYYSVNHQRVQNRIELISMTPLPSENSYLPAPISTHVNGDPDLAESHLSNASPPPPSSTPPPPLSSISSATSPYDNNADVPDNFPSTMDQNDGHDDGEENNTENTVTVQQISEDQTDASAAIVDSTATPRQVMRPQMSANSQTTNMESLLRARLPVNYITIAPQEGFTTPPIIPLRIHNDLAASQTLTKQSESPAGGKKITIV